MKFSKNYSLNVILLIKIFIMFTYSLCSEESSSDKEVLRQESDARRPYIAHIFKYSLSGAFPMKNEDLKYFCLKIDEYNIEMKKKSLKVRSLPCYDYLMHNKTITDGVVSYVLLQKPKPGDKLVKICGPDDNMIQICKYMIKDFISGFLNSVLYSNNSKNNFEVNFLVNKFGFYYGKNPKVNGEISETNSLHREVLLYEKIKPLDIAVQNEDDSFYLMVPFFRFNSPNSINKELEAFDFVKKNYEYKQMMVYLGKLLIQIYRGMNKDRDNGFNPVDGNFNPNLLRFKNLAEIYLKLHRCPKTQVQKRGYSDKYFGFSTDFILQIEYYLKQESPNPDKLIAMDANLKESFAEFISKLVNFDIKNETQFDSIESALKHPFIATIVPDEFKRSDTGN